MVELFTSVILFQFIVLSDFIYHRSALFSKLTEKMAQSVKQIQMLPGTFPKPNPCFFYCSFLPSISPLPLSVLPKYVSLYHMRHHGIGLSEAGNDFFCSYFCVEKDQSSAGYQAIYYPASSPFCCLSKCNLS